MQILQKRQTGENEIPTSLTYGEIAIDKRGRLHTSDETGTVVNPLEPALDAISNTQYDVKMLQLDRILEKKEPPMLGGFIEAFGDTKKRYSATKCTLDTSAHQLNFNGDNKINGSASFSTMNLGSVYGSAPVNAVITTPSTAQNVQSVSFTVETTSWETYPTSAFTGKIYGKQTVDGARTPLASELSTGSKDVTVKTENSTRYAFYELELTNNAGYQYVGGDDTGDFTRLSTDQSGKYPGITAQITAITPATAPVDGSYITKVIDLGVPVESGEVYLHYPALPEGATLAVLIGTATSGHVALEPEGEERTVTLGSTSLKERKYLIPPFAGAVTGVSVRVDGHREQLEDVLAVSDICVAMR